MSRFPIPMFALLLTACSAVPQFSHVHGYAEPADPVAAHGYKYPNTVDVGDVDILRATSALARFRQLAADGEKRITLRIDSFGGSIFIGHRLIRALEDTAKTNGIRVTCIVDGAAYSMAAVILESPLCQERLATGRSTILFHNGSTSVDGTAEDLKQEVGFLEALNTAMAITVAQRIGMDLAEYQSRIAGGDWTLAVPEALRFNVIDGVVSPSDIAPPGV